MNYQNSMEAYYAYAQENREIEKKEGKIKWLWFGLLIFILLFVGLSLSNLGGIDLESSKGALVESNSSKTILVEKNLTAPLPFTKKEKIIESSLPTIQEIKEVRLVEKTAIEPLSTVTESMLTSVKKKETDNQIDLLKKTTKVAVIETNSSNFTILKETSKVAVMEINSSNSPISKVKEELPVDLYHIYIIKKGETIYDIAAKQYGEKRMYLKIVKANPDLINPNNIHAGEELFLPIVDESKSYSEILNFR